ncbi:MAG: hypothetical protein J2P31_08615, partial [Blastocatellia bacterium]|nr:hypothetical protein [Blastocatellia bacterium]
MKTELLAGNSTGFWRTLRLLLGAARRRATGRKRRQQELMHHRTGSSTDALGKLGLVLSIIFLAGINFLAAITLRAGVSTAQRIEAEYHGKIVVSELFLSLLGSLESAESDDSREEYRRLLESECADEAEHQVSEVGGSKEEYERQLREALQSKNKDKLIGEDTGIGELARTGRFPAMVGSIVLLWWFAMLVSQGEGLELDFQRRRHPMWEWIFSHPVRPGAVFLAEMLAPIAANPIYFLGPLFWGTLYGFIYDARSGLEAAFLVGIPISLAAACLGKALEIGVMLRFPPRTRGAVIGF